MTADMISGFNNSLEGYQELTVTYENNTFTFYINIKKLLEDLNSSWNGNELQLSFVLRGVTAADRIVFLDAKRSGMMAALAVCSEENNIWTTTISGVNPSDQFSLYLMDMDYRPAVSKLALDL